MAENDRTTAQFRVVELASPIPGRMVGRIALFDANNDPWNPGGGSGGGIGRTEATYSTPSLDADESMVGVWNIAKSFRIMRVATSSPARLRLYATTEQRDADADRDVGTDPEGNHGLYLELVTTPELLLFDLTPQVDVSNMSDTVSTSIPYILTNTDSEARAIDTNFTYLKTEA